MVKGGHVLLAAFAIGIILVAFTYSPADNKECSSDADCVPAQCCHAAACVPESQAPHCKGVFCTMECEPGTMDCGQGHCGCVNGRCLAVFE